VRFRPGTTPPRARCRPAICQSPSAPRRPGGPRLREAAPPPEPTRVDTGDPRKTAHPPTARFPERANRGCLRRCRPTRFSWPATHALEKLRFTNDGNAERFRLVFFRARGLPRHHERRFLAHAARYFGSQGGQLLFNLLAGEMIEAAGDHDGLPL